MAVNNPSFMILTDGQEQTSMYTSYLRRLASGEGIVVVGVCVCVGLSVCLPSRDCTPQCRISLRGEGNALYSVFSSSGS